jgi:PAS domain S-box-containing protein
VLVVAFIMIFTFLIWRSARVLEADEGFRQGAEEAQSRLGAIVESSDDAIVSKTLNGIITSWNKGAERLFGYLAEEAIGRSITMIIPRERLAEEDYVLSSIRQGLTVDHFGTVRQRKDGTLIDISITVSPIRSPSGEIVGISKIARDITEQKRLARELEEASRLKDEFIATLSHELRTRSIRSWATRKSCAWGAEQGRRERALQVIERNTRALAQMVADVLDMSRIVTGAIRLDAQPCDVRPLLNAALESIQPTFEAKGVALERIMETEPVTVFGDAQRLQQIFWNLPTNAVKFTPSRWSVQVQLGRLGASAVLTVTDTGIGIEPDFLPLSSTGSGRPMDARAESMGASVSVWLSSGISRSSRRNGAGEQ